MATKIQQVRAERLSANQEFIDAQRLRIEDYQRQYVAQYSIPISIFYRSVPQPLVLLASLSTPTTTSSSTLLKKCVQLRTISASCI
jgi:hypothetical protein